MFDQISFNSVQLYATTEINEIIPLQLKCSPVHHKQQPPPGLAQTPFIHHPTSWHTQLFPTDYPFPHCRWMRAKQRNCSISILANCVSAPGFLLVVNFLTMEFGRNKIWLDLRSRASVFCEMRLVAGKMELDVWDTIGIVLLPRTRIVTTQVITISVFSSFSCSKTRTDAENPLLSFNHRAACTVSMSGHVSYNKVSVLRNLNIQYVHSEIQP